MRLSHRLGLLFSLFGLAIAGGFQYQHIRELRGECYELERTHAEATASAVRALVEDEVRAGNLARLGRNLEEMVLLAGVGTVVVRDARGRRLVGRSDDVKLTSRESHVGVPIEKVTDGIYDVERPVDLGPRGKGVVQIGIHTTPLDERLREIAGRSVRSGAMAFLAITMVAWLVGMWFGLKLERLVPRIEALPKDPLNFRPIRAESTTDEFARLVAAFNNLGASLKAETQRRRELEREKQDLSAMLVHDLKTPLTVIRSGITLLQEQMAEAPPSNGKSGKKSGPHRTFQLLQMSTLRLHRMVEDVLQLARMEEVAGLRERAPVDLAGMASACAKDFELITSDRGQKIALKLPKKEPPRVFGDPTALRRVMDNLVQNAVEHTPNGGTITLEVRPDHHHVRVSVSDSGPGVPVEARADLFRKFFQKDMKRHVGNVGLGLAFCEKAVLRHDGAIGVEDAKPHGACFFFTLPVAEPGLPLA
jgi:two-component system, OmpR family, sensor histidine kinase SaeS